MVGLSQRKSGARARRRTFRPAGSGQRTGNRSGRRASTDSREVSIERWGSMDPEERVNRPTLEARQMSWTYRMGGVSIQ